MASATDRFRRIPHRSAPRGAAHLVVVALAGAGILVLAAAAALYFLLGAGERKPHVILISIDTLRHDHVGFVGYAPEGLTTTPFLDGLAKEGTVFTHAVSSSPYTLPGHYSMLTGTPNQVHGVIDDRTGFNPALNTLPEHLNAEGYATGGFFSGPYLDPHFGFGRGFDKYWSCMKEETMYEVMANMREASPDRIKKLVIEKEIQSHLEVTSRAVTEKAIFFAKTHREDPLFLFVHYFDVHNDYTPRPPFNKRYDRDYRGWVTGHGVVRDPRFNPDMAKEDLDHLKALYNGEISWVDDNLRKLFEGLNGIDPTILENSVVIITSDHGEEFFEHGRIGHRANLHWPSLRIPLLFWGPGRIPAGVRVEDLTRIYDIHPTILDLVGIPMPDTIYGRSVKPLMEGVNLPPEPHVAELTFLPPDAKETEEYHKHYAFQSEAFKMIGFERRKWDPRNPVDFSGEVLEDAWSLYNLIEDPEEQVNLYDNAPEIREKVLGAFAREEHRMKAHLTKVIGGEVRKTATELPDEIREKLEGVGYLEGARDQRRK